MRRSHMAVTVPLQLQWVHCESNPGSNHPGPDHPGPDSAANPGSDHPGPDSAACYQHADDGVYGPHRLLTPMP